MQCNSEEKSKLRFVSTSHGTTVVGFVCNECVYNNAKFASFGKHPEICCFEQTETCSAKMPFYFFKSRNNRSVVVFSKGRIPFDIPKINPEIIKRFKTEMLLALKLLQPFDNSILYARYGTTDETKSFFDVENVLFYNIGTRNFNALTKQHISFATISCSEIKRLQRQWNIPKEYSHYYEYTLLPKPIPFPKTTKLLAEWDKFRFCKLTGLTPLASWNSIKDGADNIKIYDRINCDSGDAFSLVLEIEKPIQVEFSIMTAMKPFLDGLICAFHSSNFEKDEVDYFSQKLKCDRDKIKNEKLNVLGERHSKYIQIYRNNVKWNPADDLCHYVTISIKDGTEWRLSGKIYKV